MKKLLIQRANNAAGVSLVCVVLLVIALAVNSNQASSATPTLAILLGVLAVAALGASFWLRLKALDITE